MNCLVLKLFFFGMTLDQGTQKMDSTVGYHHFHLRASKAKDRERSGQDSRINNARFGALI